MDYTWLTVILSLGFVTALLMAALPLGMILEDKNKKES